MPIVTTYTQARAEFANLWDEATGNREIVIVHRRGHEDLALIAASELASIAETAHLLRSPKNARRLLAALRRALGRKGKTETIEQLRRESGFDDRKK